MGTPTGVGDTEPRRERAESKSVPSNMVRQREGGDGRRRKVEEDEEREQAPLLNLPPTVQIL